MQLIQIKQNFEIHKMNVPSMTILSLNPVRTGQI